MPKNKLLVVDDDAAFLDLMSLHLRRKGYHVEPAQDGHEALQLLRTKGPFDVLVTDLMMPGLSGLELLRRAKKSDPTLEVIVITAAGSLEMAISSLREEGAFDYLTKPLDMIGELSLAVERAASHRELKMERSDLQGQLISGAGQIRNVLISTGYEILAVNDKGEIIHASEGIPPTFTKSGTNGNSNKVNLPEPLQDVIQHWSVLASPKSTSVEVQWPDKEYHLLNLSPVMDESGGWVMVLRNITHQRRLESFLITSLENIDESLRVPLDLAVKEIMSLQQNQAVHQAGLLENLVDLQGHIEKALQGSNSLRMPILNSLDIGKSATSVSLPLFIEKEMEWLGDEFAGHNNLYLIWDVEENLPGVQIELAPLHKTLDLLLQRSAILGTNQSGVNISIWTQHDCLWIKIAAIEARILNEQDLSYSRLDTDEGLKQGERAEVQLAAVKAIMETIGGNVWLFEKDHGPHSIAVSVPYSA